MAGIFKLDEIKAHADEIQRVRDRHADGILPRVVLVATLMERYGYGLGDANTILGTP